MSVLAGRRFRPSLWPTLGAMALIAATIALGNWQRHRAAEKASLQAQYEATRAVASVPLSSLFGELLARPAALRYRFVQVQGEYDAPRQIYIDNRVHQGQPGYEVITPLHIDGSPYSVLVDRGWIAQGPTRAQLPVAPVAPGTMHISGRLNLPPARYVELAPSGPPGALWQNLDIARVAKQFGMTLLPVVLELQSPPDEKLIRDWPEPNLGREQHLSYMVQWYSLAALAAVLYLSLNWRQEPVGLIVSRMRETKSDRLPGVNEPKRGNRALWLILALCTAPVIASYFAYFVIHRQKQTNYGELLQPAPAPEVIGQALDGKPFALSALKGKWVLLHVDTAACPQACQRKLYASRQARTLQNAQADRVVRLWLLSDAGEPAPLLLAEHPGLQVARVNLAMLAWLPSAQSGRDAIYLIDPLGNLMMRFPADPDIRALNKDLARLLIASRV